MAKFAQQALLWISVFAVAIGALAIDWYIHLNASEWEPLLAVAGALVALLGALGWWRGPRGLRWLAAGLGWIGYFSALVFALFHGWSFVLIVAVLIPMIVINVTISRKLTRLRHAVMNDMFRIPPELALEANQPVTLHPYDGSEAEKVYADRGLLLRQTLGLALGIASFTGGGLFVHTIQDSLNAMLASLSCIVFALYLAPLFITSVIQLVHPRTLLALRHDGIVNTSGSFGEGPGLVRWREIVGMYIRGQQASWLSRRTLVVIVASPQALLSRQSFFKRALQRLYALDTTSPVVIPERILPISLEKLEELMMPYLKRAHGDNWHDDTAEVSADADSAQD